MGGPFDRFRTHRRSRRLAGHDYSGPGWTFVTICTAGRRCLLGEVRGGVVGLSNAGCIAHACWAAIPSHVPGARLDAFVVMPNHVHGLLGFEALGPAPNPTSESGPDTWPSRRDALSHLSPAARSVSVVVRSYKSAVTRLARAPDPGFAWQPRFHDHVVRDARALATIRAYVAANPAAWPSDRFHPASP